MSGSVQTEDVRPEVGFGELILFLKKSRKSVVFFAVISSLVVLFLIAAGYVLLPRQTVYSLRLSLQLQKNDRGKYVYPSEKPFSASDIISTVVLRQVYESNNLSGRVRFEDFSKLFYLSENDKEKAAITALYQSKFAKKNITLAELKVLEEEYERALEKLGHQFVGISMTSTLKLHNREEATRILQSVPAAWFDIYSKLEAELLPQMESAAQVRELHDRLAADGWLITLDQVRMVCSRLQTGCKELDRMLMGQKVALSTGEVLETLQLRLEDLELHRIRPLLLLVLMNPAYSKNPLNVVFLRSNIMDLERKINEQRAKYDGAVAAINVLSRNGSAAGEKASSPQTEQSGAPLTMNLDGNFMATLTSLIRSDLSMDLRKRYAAEAFKIKADIAKLEADKVQYEAMLRILEQPKSASGQLTPEQFGKLEKRMFDELILLCGKVNEFRELATKDYLSSRKFFTTTGEVQRISSFQVPFKYIAALLVFLLIVANGIYIGTRFSTALSSGELKR